MAELELEQTLKTILDNQSKLLPTIPGQLPTLERQFLESPGHDGFGMSLSKDKMSKVLKVSSGSIPVIALGVVMSTTIGGYVSRLLPSIGQWAPVLAGGILLMVVPTGLLRDLAAGVLIGGVANIISGYTSGMFSMGMGSQNNMMAEDLKSTYGGGEGIYPMQPDRRTFA